MDYDTYMAKKRAIDAFTIGYDLGVAAAKAAYEKKGVGNEN